MNESNPRVQVILEYENDIKSLQQQLDQAKDSIAGKRAQQVGLKKNSKEYKALEKQIQEETIFADRLEEKIKRASDFVSLMQSSMKEEAHLENAKANSTDAARLQKAQIAQEEYLSRIRQKFSIKRLGFIGKVIRRFGTTVINRLAKLLLRAIVESAKVGVQDLYKWSQNHNGAFASAVDSILEDFRYIADIVGSIVGPFIEALAPVIRRVADAFAAAAEKANQFFAVLLGRNGYYRALRVAREYQGIQNQLLGFDELNVLQGGNDSGGGNFEDVGYNKKLTALGEEISRDANSLIGIGAILLFTGHPLIGAAVLAGGVAAKYVAASDNVDLQKKIKNILKGINTVVDIAGPYAFVIGTVLAFAGYWQAGIPLMAASLASGSVNWNSIVENMQGPLGTLTGLLGGAMLALGGVLAFADPTPKGKAIGVAMLVAGAAGLVTAVALNWDSIKTTLQRILPPIATILAGSLLVLGAILTFSGNFPLGIPLLTAGVATLGVVASHTTWGQAVLERIQQISQDIVEKIRSLIERCKTIVSTFWQHGIDVLNNLVEKVKDFTDKVKTKAEALWDTIKQGFNNLKEAVIAKATEMFSPLLNTIQTIKSWLEAIFGKTYKINVDDSSLNSANRKASSYGRGEIYDPDAWRPYASGGTPTTGTLFYAGEAGPELVTSFNGQSTVYNESQLAGSLAAANTGVIQAVYDMADAVVTAIVKKPTGVTVNDVRSAINSQALRYGL